MLSVRHLCDHHGWGSATGFEQEEAREACKHHLMRKADPRQSIIQLHMLAGEG